MMELIIKPELWEYANIVGCRGVGQLGGLVPAL